MFVSSRAIERHVTHNQEQNKRIIARCSESEPWRGDECIEPLVRAEDAFMWRETVGHSEGKPHASRRDHLRHDRPVELGRVPEGQAREEAQDWVRKEAR